MIAAPEIAFIVVLAATGVMRLVEAFVSRRRLHASPTGAVAEPVLFPAMVALHVALILLPIVEVRLWARPFVPVLAGAALAVLVVATALRIWTLGTIGGAWNVRIVAPAPDAVVTGGPYRFVRHPNYLCVILEIAALPLLHSAVISAVTLSLANAIILAVRIRREEGVLSRIPQWQAAFGDRARLIPFLF